MWYTACYDTVQLSSDDFRSVKIIATVLLTIIKGKRRQKEEKRFLEENNNITLSTSISFRLQTLKSNQITTQTLLAFKNRI